MNDLEASYDTDLVLGKGKGLILLLHGAPGVGKTSTAETVADTFGKILFPITCGDLGLTAAEVESQLSGIFQLAELWDCVLLLDEADVFLARRTKTDIKRNSLVSVFLRVLEHFTSVLFLTTNRVGAFDEAFKSRIHISLYYPPLDAKQSLGIWRMNLKRLIEKKERRNESILFNEKKLLAYAADHYTETFQRGINWNGRQIRNAFQTASALAEFEAHKKSREAETEAAKTGEVFGPIDPQLEVRHFEQIALASSEFDRYISETKGFSDAQIAHLEGQRTDEYRPIGRLMRHRVQQPTQIMETPALLSAPIHGPGTTSQGRATPSGHVLVGRNRQMYSPTHSAFNHDSLEGQDPDYDQPPPRRGTKSASTYASPNAATMPRSERPNVARSQPRPVQQPRSFATSDQERQRYEALDQNEIQYVDEDEDEQGYEPSYKDSASYPMSNFAHFEETKEDVTYARPRQAGGHHAITESLPPLMTGRTSRTTEALSMIEKEVALPTLVPRESYAF